MMNIFKNKLLVILGFAVFAVVSVYVGNFSDHGFSTNPEQWGQLGDYFGGILNPILSFVTIVILVANSRVQSDQLKASQDELVLTRDELALTRDELSRSAEAATRQASHFEREATLKEYLLLIDKLVARINNNFNENKLDQEYSLHYFVSFCASGRNQGYVAKVMDFWSKSGSKTKRVISWVESDLERLSALIAEYERIVNAGRVDEKDQSPMPKFYQREFGELVSVLYSHAMVSAALKEFYSPES